MVRNLGMGVAGAAWATLIAQGLSAVLSFAVFHNRLKKVAPPLLLQRQSTP